jgi:DNA-binding XRE family transcriptional regulator
MNRKRTDKRKDAERRFYWEVGYRIRVARDLAKTGQAVLAKTVGVSRSSIANIEAGKHRSAIVDIAIIADVLGQRLDVLIPKWKDVCP